ncbi:ComF family protein [Comamonas sp. UBA7528]|uniref:ComF family protein n=1 Tax=Comamonas sp. UBA7528 TaxID=1946391 RepID=UPI0025BAC8F3|nr:phosphoribosyltransferase family protein [Comamonas sp. UBA7528]
MRLHIPAWLSARIPSQCMACGSWPAQPLCAQCQARFAQTVARCRSCALRLPDAHAGAHCGQCLRHPPVLQHCLVAVDYGYPWALPLTQWKLHAQPAIGRHLAQWLQQHAAWPALRDGCALTIPIPLSPQRLRSRGYNQALLLARALDCPAIQPQLLQRTHDTPTQMRQGRAARLRNLRGAFSVPPQHQGLLRGKTVLLVDDVITTGATLQAAAQALLAAGASQVHAVALARTP